MLSKEFRGEIWSNVDSRILEVMAKANTEPVDGCVGADKYSVSAHEIMQSFFQTPIYTTYAINGTGANILAMKAMLDRYSAIICARETHINVYEAGAFEYTLGNKILVAESENGKLTPESVDILLKTCQKYKYLPKVIAITQPTELGTVYTNEELRAICNYAHEKDMYVYIDGARIGNAAVALGTTLTKMIEETGVDAFSFGGTKAGAMFGEMVVFLREAFSRHLPYLQKQSFQHFDKSKFLGVQLYTILEQELWLKNAEIANEKAKLLEKVFAEKGVPIFYPVESNAVFAVLSDTQVEHLSKAYDFHYWNVQDKTVRFITTAGTKDAEIQRLADFL